MKELIRGRGEYLIEGGERIAYAIVNEIKSAAKGKPVKMVVLTGDKKKEGTLVERVKDAMRAKDYTIFTQPYVLNIVGIRSKTREANKFDDKMVVFYYDDKGEEIVASKNGKKEYWDITTDPGNYYLKGKWNKEKTKREWLSPEGCAILKEGQYKDCWIVGYHRYEYIALIQVTGKVTVYRDDKVEAKYNDNINEILDLNIKEDVGYHGIDIHKVSKKFSGQSYTVKNASAGCQVFSNSNDFKKFMEFVYKQRDIICPGLGIPPNIEKKGEKWEELKKREVKFSYTLLDNI